MDTSDKTLKFAVYHRENQIWLKSIAFYQHEIKYFTDLLLEVSAKNTDEEILGKISDFKRRFTEYSEAFAEVLHKITNEEMGFDDYVEGKEFLFSQAIFDTQRQIREKFNENEMGFIGLKHAFHHFLAGVL